jgi:hypothetical protein
LINEILEQEGLKCINRLDEVVEVEAPEVTEGDIEDNFVAKSDHSKPGMTSHAPLSKSALKRLRRKQRDLVENEVVGEETEEEVKMECEINDEVVKQKVEEEPSLLVVPVVELRTVPKPEMLPSPPLPPQPVAVQSVQLPPTTLLVPSVDLSPPSRQETIGIETTTTSNAQQLVNFLLGKESLTTNTSSIPFGSRLNFGGQYVPSAPSINDPVFLPSAGSQSNAKLSSAPPGLTATHPVSRPTTAPSIGFTSYRNASSVATQSVLKLKN